MWIEKLENGKFKAVERYEDVLTGKQKRVSITMEKNTAQERKRAQETLSEKIKAAQHKDKRNNFTLKELIDAYKKDKKGSVKESTYTRNCSVCNTFLKIFGEDILISKLTVKIIKERFKDTGKSNNTINEYIHRFKTLMRWGYKNEMIADISFIDKLDKYKDDTRKQKLKEKYLESYELKKLLENMRNERYMIFTKFLVLTGMRIGEALALDINDLDMMVRIIHITKTYDTNNYIVTTPKNDPSTRDIYMQDELYTLCKDIRMQALEKKLKTGFNALFQNKGKRYTIGNYTEHLKNDSSEFINHKITPHALRHTYVALMAEQGVSLEVISRRLGHHDSKVTREIYFHVTEGLKKKDNEQLKSVSIL